MLVAALPRVEAAQDEQAAAIEKRLADSVRYLTSEELMAAASAPRGLDLAAAYIAKQFEEAGLKINLFDGKPFQPTTPINTATDLGPDNRLTLAGPPPRPGEKPQSIPVGVGKDFTPLAMSGSAAFDAPLVFVGYAISGKAEKYDDFQGIDVAGKVLIVLRDEPQQDDPKSVFDGSAIPPTPGSIARWPCRRGRAAAVVFCTDELGIRKHLVESRRKSLGALDRLAAAQEKPKRATDLTPGGIS